MPPINISKVFYAKSTLGKFVLDIYAGPKALKEIQEKGFTPELFHTVLGASGGPKWFVLAGLDRVLVPEFLDRSDNVIDFVGSSAGAFRFACLTQQDTTKAINVLAKHYSETVYSNKPTVEEISVKAEALIDRVLSDNAVEEILNNPKRRAHFVVAKCSGMVASENKLFQTIGLAMSALHNAFDRENLTKYFQRFVFSVGETPLNYFDPAQIESHHVSLTPDNIADALLASGAIPGVLKGIKDIAGAAPGMYRDGGVTDYHFDLSFSKRPGLVLFPHFYSYAVPGWFDKMLSWRHPHKSCFDNVVMLVPSEEFLRSLPYCKIPDRHDFTKMTPEQRLPYWKTVLSESDRLGESFINLVQNGNVVDKIQPLKFKLAE